ncbi:MAG TPA: protein kinase [Vicinamibacterales bacterium]|nr:protein kinase [Vicinamibacterales bacterium]
MSLPTGARLGPYEIVAPIGAGGMGEVYRARDTRLDRSVAIKVLRDWAGRDSEHRERFKREAQIVASLDHPHICGLHDVGREGDVDYFVMPFLAGETLAARIARGPMPMAEVLPLAIHIADALDRAHRRGVVHRDLKPGNVMLTPTGPRLLDFGLAKVATPPLADLSNTQTREVLTQNGRVMGTLPYMAPEQVLGQATDSRTDVWAFGCLLYQMISGRRPFEASTDGELIKAILATPPAPLSSTGIDVPLAVQSVVEGALSKDPDDRWQSMADVKRVLAMAGAPARLASPSTSSARVPVWLVAAASILALATIGLGAMLYASRSTAPPGSTVYFTLDAPPSDAIPRFTDSDPYFAASPDGRHIAFITQSRSGVWIKTLDQATPVLLADTAGAVAPFWSPDSKTVAFVAGGEIRRRALGGGTTETVCKVEGIGVNGTWNGDGVIVFAEWTTRQLKQVKASGGTPALLREGQWPLIWPEFLPDGRHFLFGTIQLDRNARQLFVGSLDGGEPTLVAGVTSRAQYVDGRLFFWHDGNLMSQAFATTSFTLSGEAALVAEHVHGFSTTGFGAFSVSPDLLLYQAGDAAGHLVWADRRGAEVETLAPSADFIGVRISPDGTLIAYSARDPKLGSGDIFVHDLKRGVTTQVTNEPQTENVPMWSPDGLTLAYAADRHGPPNVHARPASGAGQEREIVAPSVGPQAAGSFLPDGQSLLITDTRPETGRDIFLVPFSGTGQPEPIVQSKGRDAEARITHDGKWLAYSSDESGRNQVYVRALRDPRTRRQVSRDGGISPRWKADGSELFYVGGPSRNQILAVDIKTSAAGIEPAAPHLLFTKRATIGEYDVSSDGQRFLLNIPNALAERGTVSAILNWK